MFRQLLLVTLFALLNGQISAKRHEPHADSAVRIVGFNGPLSKETLTLFKSAELLEFIDCHITSVPEKLFSLLQDLRILYVENVTSTNVHEDSSEGNDRIEEIYYIKGDWENPDAESVNGMTNLRKFKISEHKQPFTEIKANSFDRTKLRSLEISKSGVEKIDDLAFNGLDKLYSLRLHGNKLKTIRKEMFLPLKHLEELDLHGNLLESFSASQLPELPELTRLNLAKNPLKTVDFKDIGKVAPNLKYLKLTGTQIPADVVEELKKTTNIKISH